MWVVGLGALLAALHLWSPADLGDVWMTVAAPTKAR